LRLWLHRLDQSHHGPAVKSRAEEDWQANGRGVQVHNDSLMLGLVRPESAGGRLLTYPHGWFPE
jgi:hypothetical protein